MLKIKDIVKVEKKERNDWHCELEHNPITLDKGYNLGQEDLGNKKIGLLEEKIIEVVFKDLNDRRGYRQLWDELDERIKQEIKQDIIQALKAKEDEIIVEVEE